MNKHKNKWPRLVKEEFDVGRKDLLVFLAQGLGSGCITPMQGTWGTLGGVLVYLLALTYIVAGVDYYYWIGFVIFSCIAGIPLCSYAETKLASKDPHSVVWDEWCGIWLAYAWLPFMPLTSVPIYVWLIIGFVLFRWLDITKPWLIGMMERNFKKGAGIMLDDIVAGLATGAIVYLLGVVTALTIS